MVRRAKESLLLDQLPAILAGMLNVPPGKLTSESPPDRSGGDLLVTAPGHTFVIEFKQTASSPAIAAAAKQVHALAKRTHRKSTALLAVPFMGDIGKRICKEEGVSWIDLSGNANITGTGIRIVVDGMRNRFRTSGRPPNLFAPTSSRIVRWLLMHPGETFTQRQLAHATNMTEGFVSRISRRLEDEGYIVRDDSGGLRPKDPGLLLDAWQDAYQFSKHTLIQGHIATRSGDALCLAVGAALTASGIEHAATGLAAAWQYTHFASFRVASFFVRRSPTVMLTEQMGFREETPGANLWLLVPSDDGVFHGARDQDGVRCVHPVQAYVDLKTHAERAAEAATQLRATMLTWNRDG